MSAWFVGKRYEGIILGQKEDAHAVDCTILETILFVGGELIIIKKKRRKKNITNMKRQQNRENQVQIEKRKKK